MLPRKARELVRDSVPKINPKLGNGLAVDHFKQLENYIDSVHRAVAERFPAGLKYLGLTQVDPIAQFREETRSKSQHSSRHIYDMAKSCVYMVGIRFQWEDTPPFTQHIYLPYVEQGGTTMFNGSKYAVVPVLADRIISIGPGYVFLRLNKTRITIKNHGFRYICNDRVEEVYVTHGQIHHNKERGPNPSQYVNANHTVVHYLLCKYGFSEMFRKFVGCVPKVISVKDIAQHQSADVVICRTLGNKPARFKGDHTPTQIALVIPRSHYKEHMKSLVAGFFYVTDHFPFRVVPNYMDDVRLWRVLLGHLIWSPYFSEGRLIADVDTHFDSLDSYIDTVTQRKINAEKINVKDIYELLAYVNENYTTWQLKADDTVRSMYGKELSILTFVCSDLTNAINQWHFRLTSAAKKPLDRDRIMDLVSKSLKRKDVFKITRGHGELISKGTSGDNMALQITCNLIPQTDSTKRQKATPSAQDASWQLDASIAEVGGYSSLPKNRPDGRARLNLYLQIDETGGVVRSEQYRSLIDSVQEKIRRKRATSDKQKPHQTVEMLTIDSDDTEQEN